MKKALTSILLLLSLASLKAQTDEIKTEPKIGAYRIEQDEVVFVFNPYDHSEYCTSYGMWKSKSKVKVKSVIVSGEFNNWPTNDKKYEMKAINNTYEYRMKLSDFKGKTKIEFKYVVNNKYWAEPNTYFSNLTRSLMDYPRPMNFVLNLVKL